MLENIGPKESRKRLALGVGIFTVTVLLLVLMVYIGIGRWWRLFLFIPFMMSTLGFYQYREKTCVALASQGFCNFDEGTERIEDDEFKRLLTEKARQVQFHSFFAAAALTALAIAIPD